MEVNLKRVEDLIAEAFKLLHFTQEEYNVAELDLNNTPKRIAKMWHAIAEGKVKDNAPDVVTFKSDHDEVLLTKDIEFVSWCSHHFLPIQGVAHIAYIPSNKVMGLSKAARVLDWFAARPQTQELLVRQVANHLWKELSPVGIAVIIEARHDCISCRGAKKPGVKFTTSKLMGRFLESGQTALRSELMALINRR